MSKSWTPEELASVSVAMGKAGYMTYNEFKQDFPALKVSMRTQSFRPRNAALSALRFRFHGRRHLPKRSQPLCNNSNLRCLWHR